MCLNKEEDIHQPKAGQPLAETLEGGIKCGFVVGILATVLILGSALSTQAATCNQGVEFTAFMTDGTVGQQVRDLQTTLKCLGYFPSEIDATGYYGPVTIDSVEKFQSAHGIDSVGYVGPQTRAALNGNPTSCVTPVSPPPAPTPEPEPTPALPTTINVGCGDQSPIVDNMTLEAVSQQVRDLQTALKCLGYFPADTDPTAYYGPVTQESVRKFQSAHGIEANGNVGPATRDQINSSPKPYTSPAPVPAPEPTPSPEPQEPGIIAYQDPNYQGRSESFDIGSESDLRNTLIGNDTISSIKIFGGAVVQLFEHINLRGTVEVLSQSDSNLIDNLIQNDNISSFRVARHADQLPDPTPEPEPEPPPAPPTTINVGCGEQSPIVDNMSLGAISQQVRDLQTALKCLGYFPADTNPTAYYGPVTQASVRKFQSAHGIEVNGNVGPATRDQINSSPKPYIAPAPEPEPTPTPEPTPEPTPNPEPEPIPPPTPNPNPSECTRELNFTRFLIIGDTGSEIKELQTLLQCLGYYSTGAGTSTTFDSLTQEAVKQFQSAKGIPVVGYVGLSTRNALNQY
ncbi:peptidoglycan-binding protein [Patescibacteria group bacterium]